MLSIGITLGKARVISVDAKWAVTKGSNSIVHFIQTYTEEIDYIKETYPVVSYVVGNDSDFPYAYMKNKESAGMFYEMFDFFENMLNIEFKQIMDVDYQTAVDQLESNEIQLLTGLLFLSNEETSLVEKGLVENEGSLAISRLIDTNRAILIGKEVKEEYSQEIIRACYWGTQDLLFPILIDGYLEDHIIVYNSLEEAILAMHADEIQGLFIKEKNYQKLVDELPISNVVVGESTEYLLEERFTYCAENKELNEMLDKLITLYLSINSTEEGETRIAINLNELSENTIHVLKIGTFLVLLLVAIVLIYFIYQKLHKMKVRRIRYRELEKKLVIKGEEEDELLHIDIRKRKITSNKYFGILGLKQFKHSLSIKELTKLTGYDYTVHYMNISIQGEDVFVEEYSLFVNGDKLQFIERGVYADGYIVSVLSKE